MKISNKTKDYLVLLSIMIIVLCVLTVALYFVKNLLAEDSVYLSDIEKMNKHYAEERIKTEMNFLAMKHYMDNISIEEYVKTFYSK